MRPRSAILIAAALLYIVSAYVPEDYLPDQLVGETIYEPSDSGFERELAARRAALIEQKKR